MRAEVFEDGIEALYGSEFEVVRRPKAHKRAMHCPMCGWKVEARRVSECRRCGEWLR